MVDMVDRMDKVDNNFENDKESRSTLVQSIIMEKQQIS